MAKYLTAFEKEAMEIPIGKNTLNYFKTYLPRASERFEKNGIQRSFTELHRMMKCSYDSSLRYENLEFLPEAAAIMGLWNDYHHGEKIRADLVALITFAQYLFVAKKCDLFEEAIEFASAVRRLPFTRNAISFDKDKCETLNVFLYNYCLIDADIADAARAIYTKNTMKIDSAGIEKELIAKYTKEDYYQLIFKGVPKMFWYDPEDEKMSRYHWVLTKTWPDVRTAMSSCGIPHCEQNDLVVDQGYSNVFTDVMSQMISKSISGETQLINVGTPAQAQRARQFILKFMMDKESMAKAYVHVAKVKTDTLPETERMGMYKVALNGPDPTNPDEAN